jgi:hypothetical protein
VHRPELVAVGVQGARERGDAAEVGQRGTARGAGSPSSRSSTKSRTSSPSSSRPTVTPPSSASRQSPIALRRSANGSLEPVGRLPRPKLTCRLSILSAADTSRPASVLGSGASAPSGR